MPRIVLTVIGDDRPGLVKALAEVVSNHSGNWERSQMAELAGKFAGIVVVSLPAERTEELTAALRELEGLLEVSGAPRGGQAGPGGTRMAHRPARQRPAGHRPRGVLGAAPPSPVD